MATSQEVGTKCAWTVHCKTSQARWRPMNGLRSSGSFPSLTTLELGSSSLVWRIGFENIGDDCPIRRIACWLSASQGFPFWLPCNAPLALASIVRSIPARRTVVLVDLAAFHHKHNPAHSGNVFQRVAIQGNDVGGHACRDGTNLIFQVQ